MMIPDLNKKICVSIGACSYDECRSLLKKYYFVELRADLLQFSEEEFRQLFKSHPNLIFTCRKGDNHTELQRKSLYQIAFEEQVAWLDLDPGHDLDILNQLTFTGHRPQLILSYHEQGSFPADDLISFVYETFKANGADMVKMAFMIEDLQQNVRLLSLYKEYPGALLLGMGTKGKLSRVAAPFFGAPFTFAFPDELKATAPGQLPYSQLKNLLEIFNPDANE